MNHALGLARRATARVFPNPKVGAVFVKSGKIVAEGWHKRCGGDHAEIDALKRSDSKLVKNSTLYVTLEPCSHQGRTPPCIDEIVRVGVKRVVIASLDPNPKVSSVRKLKSAGIRVTTGILKSEAERLNVGFFKFHKTGLPHVHLKISTSLDGYLALPSGQSQWLTGREVQRKTHDLRRRSAAMMTGIGTVLADDPLLNVRLGRISVQPARLILDSRLRISKEAQMLTSSGPGGDIHLFTLRDSSQRKRQALLKKGVQIHTVKKNKQGSCDLVAVLKKAAELGFLEIHVEAGATLSGALFRAGLVDELTWFKAPILLGSGYRPEFIGVRNLSSAQKLKQMTMESLGNDVMLHGFLSP